MDHDRLFKQLLTTFFVEFIELFFPALAAYLDRSSVTFLDKEIFTDVTQGERHQVDLVVEARFRDQPSYFLVHMEPQAERRAGFPRRMFGYFSRLNESADAGPAAARSGAAGLDLRLCGFVLAAYNRAGVRIFPGVESARKRRAGGVMEIVTSWMEKGLEKERRLVLRLLRKRLGEVDPDEAGQVETLTAEQLEELGEALLGFEHPDDLTAWLAANAPLARAGDH